MDLNEMIKYYYSSAKIRQENSKNVINREVTSAKDDIQARDQRMVISWRSPWAVKKRELS